MADLDLTTAEGLLEAVAAFDESWVRKQRGSSAPLAASVPEAGDEVGTFTGTFCARCGDFRRMKLVAHERVSRLNPRYIKRQQASLAEFDASFDPLAFAISVPPPLLTATCLQCQTRLSLVVDAGPPVEVVVLGARTPGLATSNTPTSVAFYLEQAYRARTRGAFTAAVVMYRAALEQFLLAQGFTERSLHDRVEAAVAVKPRWIKQLDDELMHALRELGNRAVHSDDGDVSNQAVIDRELVREIENLFADVLQEVYEEPARRTARRERFRQARDLQAG